MYLNKIYYLYPSLQNYTSSTSHTINVEAGASFDGFGVSAKFSDEYGHLKNQQISEKTQTVRTQMRYNRSVYSKLKQN